MSWTLIQTAEFQRRWRSQRLPDEDLQALEMAIMRDPAGSGVMKGTGGLRKTRFAPPSRGRGKSGSMRVCYARIAEFERIYLVTLFLKKDADNLSARDCRAIKVMLNDLGDALRRGHSP